MAGDPARLGVRRRSPTSPSTGTHRAPLRCPNINLDDRSVWLHRVVEIAPTERSDMRVFPTVRGAMVATFTAFAATTAVAILNPTFASPVSPAAIQSGMTQSTTVQLPDAVQQVQFRGRSARGIGRSYGRGSRFRGRPAFRGRQFGGRSAFRGRQFGRSYYRGGYRGPRYGYRSYGYAPWIGGAIASTIIGGSIAASQSSYGDAWQRCDDRYRSFRWSDGTFQPYGDEPRKLCPYLAN